jgi:type II secretory pathway pseudopilin PulG
MKKSNGFTLIELIIFIIVIGLASATVLSGMDIILKTQHTTQDNDTAVQVASRCLEWYWGQNQMNGYSSITCPSTTLPSFCSAPSGFTTAVSVTCTTLYSETSANYKTIAVAVTGKGTASLSLLLANDGT